MRTLMRHLSPYATALAVLLLVRESRIAEKFNLWVYDLAVQLRPSPSGASTPVRIIAITEADLRHYGPLVPDGLLADAIERLDRAGVAAIGLDLFCDQPAGEGHQRLRRLAATNRRLVSVFFDPDGRRAIPGTPQERQASADLYTDPADGVVRRDLLGVLGQHSAREVSLPLRLLEIAHGGDRLRRRPLRYPVNLPLLEPGSGGYHPNAGVSSPEYRQRLLAFHRPGSFPTWSLRALLEGKLNPQEIRQLRGSIVLIGTMAPSKKDAFAVPFSSGGTGERRFEMAGVELHAHRLAALWALDAGRSLGLQAAPAVLNTATLMVAIFTGTALGEGIPGLRLSLALVVGTALLGIAAWAGLLWWGLWLDGALPLTAFSLAAGAAWLRRGADQQQQRRHLERGNLHIRALFSRFVSRDVVDELLADAAPPEAGGERREVTILMADLRGFSLISQSHQPERVVRMLNNYLAVMVEVVEHNGGTIDEVIGDAILVLFGAPVPRYDHGEAAIICALEMQLAMTRVNSLNTAQDLPVVAMGIGICTGEVVVGTIGTSSRAKYGVVGSAVNLAARIESMSVGDEILVAESTLKAVASPLRVDGEHLLEPKGSAEPVQVYSIGAIASRPWLALPIRQQQRVELPQPIRVRFAVLRGKLRDPGFHTGTVTHLTDRGVWLEVDEQPLEAFMNLLLLFPEMNEEVYAKVRSIVNNNVQVEFSTIPDRIASLLAACRPHG